MFDCEVVGPIARSVSDVRRMFECLAHSRSGQVVPENVARPERARIRFVERIQDAPVDPRILESGREAATRFSALGHTVSYGVLPFSIDAAMFAWQAITSVGLCLLAKREPRFFEAASAEFINQAKAGESLSAADYCALIETLLAFRTCVAQAFDSVDIVMTPATAAQPWP